MGWLRELDAVGNRGFSGAANAAKDRAPKGARILTLMGDWCATAQPNFENQACDELEDGKKYNAAPKAGTAPGEDCCAQATRWPWL
jgi:hypothetical protein